MIHKQTNEPFREQQVHIKFLFLEMFAQFRQFFTHKIFENSQINQHAEKIWVIVDRKVYLNHLYERPKRLLFVQDE